MNIMSHERIEKSVVILGILTFFAVIWGGLVQIVPLFFDNQLRPENSYVKPYDPLRLAAALRDAFDGFLGEVGQSETWLP